MAFTDSHILREFITSNLVQKLGTGWGGLSADTVKAALFSNTGTPDRNASSSLYGYNAATSAWVTANEITGASEWVAGGRTLASKTFTNTSNTFTFTAANLAGSATVTMSGILGCLVYDSTVSGSPLANPGVCYNWFGGSQSVTAGTFSVNWNAAGIFNMTV